MNSDYKTVDGLIRSGCSKDDAEQITKLVEIIDKCFKSHDAENVNKVGKHP